MDQIGTQQIKVLRRGSKIRCVQFVHNRNFGRARARNVGLYSSDRAVTVFLDSDIVLSRPVLENHLRIQAGISLLHTKCITCGLFRFLKLEKVRQLSLEDVEHLSMDDFRIECLYEDRFAGCSMDKSFSGQMFRLLSETEDFRQWPNSGKLGPWYLPNMVLGGLFSVLTRSAKNVRWV